MCTIYDIFSGYLIFMTTIKIKVIHLLSFFTLNYLADVVVRQVQVLAATTHTSTVTVWSTGPVSWGEGRPTPTVVSLTTMCVVSCQTMPPL